MAFITLRNISGEPLLLGLRDGRRVAEGEVVRIEGTLAKEQPDDAIVIGEGDDARAYPKTLWAKAGEGQSNPDDVVVVNPEPTPETADAETDVDADTTEEN